MIRTDSYLSCAEANHTLLHRALMISRNQVQINTGLKCLIHPGGINLIFLKTQLLLLVPPSLTKLTQKAKW